MAVARAIVLALVILAWGAAPAANAEPDYAKWGRLAVKETAKKYKADIIDYKHLGRRTERPGVESESFRLLLDKGTRRFGVLVSIWFDRETERVVEIRFKEDGERGKRDAFYKIV